MIREYTPDDIIFIEQVGQVLDPKYAFKINPYTKCLVYEQDRKIIGFVVFSIIYEKAEIIDIAVSKEFQGQHIGTKLMNAFLEECDKNKCENITLEVRNNNFSAIIFYKKFGFRELSVRKSYYRDGEDALVMIKMVIQ